MNGFTKNLYFVILLLVVILRTAGEKIVPYRCLISLYIAIKVFYYYRNTMPYYVSVCIGVFVETLVRHAHIKITIVSQYGPLI